MPTNPYQPPGRRSRWPQFSLRTLLAVVAGIAVVVAIGAEVLKKPTPPPPPQCIAYPFVEP